MTVRIQSRASVWSASLAIVFVSVSPAAHAEEWQAEELTADEDEWQKADTGEAWDLTGTAFFFGMFTYWVVIDSLDAYGGSTTSVTVKSGGTSTEGSFGWHGLGLFAAGSATALLAALPEQRYRAGFPRSIAVGMRSGAAEGLLIWGSQTEAAIGGFQSAWLGTVAGGLTGAALSWGFEPSYDSIAFAETAPIWGAWGGLIAGRYSGANTTRGAQLTLGGYNLALLLALGMNAADLAPDAGFSWWTTLGMSAGGATGLLVDDGGTGVLLGALLGAVLPLTLGASPRTRSTQTSFSITPIVTGGTYAIRVDY